MKEYLLSVTPVQWVVFGTAVLALLLSLFALLRANKALRLATKKPPGPAKVEVEPAPEMEERPEVALEISADRDEHDQVRMLLRNNGSLAVRYLKLSIASPERIFNSEGLSEGLDQADVSGDSAILPRLAVLDADNLFPLEELISGSQISLPAVLTMAYGKICDFPVTARWRDGKGRSQQQKYRITI